MGEPGLVDSLSRYCSMGSGRDSAYGSLTSIVDNLKQCLNNLEENPRDSDFTEFEAHDANEGEVYNTLQQFSAM